jgi:hypothetical protein
VPRWARFHLQKPETLVHSGIYFSGDLLAIWILQRGSGVSATAAHRVLAPVTPWNSQSTHGELVEEWAPSQATRELTRTTEDPWVSTPWAAALFFFKGLVEPGSVSWGSHHRWVRRGPMGPPCCYRHTGSPGFKSWPSILIATLEIRSKDTVLVH